MKLARKGLSIIEASFVLAALVAGILMMQIYFKRAIQGRLRAVSDGLSETQYSPGDTTSRMTTTISTDYQERPREGAGALSAATSNETRSRTGYERVNRQ